MPEPEVATPPSAPAGRARRWEHWFFGGLALLCATGAGIRPETLPAFGEAIACAALLHTAHSARDIDTTAQSLDRLAQYRGDDPAFQSAVAVRRLILPGPRERRAALVDDLQRRGVVAHGSPELLCTIARLGHGDALRLYYGALLVSRPGSVDDLEARYSLAMALDDLGRRAEAEALLDSLVLSRPTEPAYLNALGYHLADCDRDLERAETLIEAAVRRHEWSLASRLLRPSAHGRVLGSYLDSLGWVAYRRNRRGEAERLLARAEALTADEPSHEILYHIAQLAYDRGDDRKAQRYLKQVLDLAPTYAPALRLRDRLEHEGGGQIIRRIEPYGLPAGALEIHPCDRERRQA